MTIKGFYFNTCLNSCLSNKRRNQNIDSFCLHFSGLFYFCSQQNSQKSIHVLCLTFHKVLMTFMMNKVKSYISNNIPVHLINDLFLLKFFLTLYT